MSRSAIYKWVGVPLAVGAVVAVSACGSSDNNDGPSTTPSSSGAAATSAGGDPAAAGIASAKEIIKPAITKPTDLGIDKELSKTPPTGKKVLLVGSSNELAQVISKGAIEAAKSLGWTVQNQTWDTPDKANGMILAGVQQKVDYIFTSAAPSTTIAQGIAAAKAANIPIFNGADSVEPDPAKWLFSNINGPVRFERAGTIAAAYSIVDSQGKANVLHAYVTGVALQALDKGMKDEFAKDCSGCKIDSLPFTFTDLLGNKVPGLIVNYLRSHPDVNQLTVSCGGCIAGVAPAMQTANLTGIKLTTVNTVNTNLGSILKGEEAWSLAEGLAYVGWVAVDAMARYSVGDDLQPNWDQSGKNPEFFRTKDNIKSATDEFTGPTDYENGFKKLWKVS